jgi:hypothetical protein
VESHLHSHNSLRRPFFFPLFQGNITFPRRDGENTVTGDSTLAVRYKINCPPPLSLSHSVADNALRIYYKQAIWPPHHKVHFLWL